MASTALHPAIFDASALDFLEIVLYCFNAHFDPTSQVSKWIGRKCDKTDEGLF